MQKKGFTLVEILIVIGIITTLSLFALGAYVHVQRTGRDAKRIADLNKIKIALQAYYTQYGQYPGSTASYGESNCSGWDTSYTDGDNDGNSFIDPLVEARILPKVPVDPLNSSASNCSGHFPTPGPNYFYYRYMGGEGSFSCNSKKPFIVLGVGDMESSDGTHPQSPGFKCLPGEGTRDWNENFEYVMGFYE